MWKNEQKVNLDHQLSDVMKLVLFVSCVSLSSSTASNLQQKKAKNGQQNCWKKPNTPLKKAEKRQTLHLTKPNLLRFACPQLKFTSKYILCILSTSTKSN